MQRMMVPVSVIIPNYNHARFLPQRIESILNQSYSNFECIILDDGSTDNSKEIITEYAAKDSRIVFYHSQENSGSPFIQWNKGVHLAKYELIWIAESDDFCDNNLLQSLIDAHLHNSEIGLAYCQSTRMNEVGNFQGSWKTFTDDMDAELFKQNFVMEGMEFISRFLIYKNIIPNASGVLFKKSCFMAAGGADESLKHNSDWLTWLKVLSNKKVAFVAEPQNMFRYHPGSVIAKHSSSKTNTYREEYDFTMRIKYEAWCKRSKVKLSREVLSANHQFISYDIGNRGLHSVNHGKWVQSFSDIIRASVFPKLTLGYLRRLFKKEKP